MDQLDEFEMKPLTSGLGFQKRVSDLKQGMKRSRIAQDKLSLNIPVAAPPDEMAEAPAVRKSDQIIEEIRQALHTPTTGSPNGGVKLSSTLPRPGDRNRVNAMNPEIERAPAPRDRDPLSGINFQVPAREILDKPTVGVRRGASDSMIRPLVPISFSPAASFVDLVIIAAFSMIFLAALVSVTGIDVSSVLTSARTDVAAQGALLVLGLSVMQIYLVLSRSFFGRTIGDWAFEIQLGENQQIENPTYPLRVLSRNFLNLVTGLVTLPLLSLVFDKDLAGKMTGLPLMKQNV